MTFSIVARDPQTGAFGVATATAGPMVGALVPHIKAGLGAAATQAMTNPYLAIDTLDRLGEMDAEKALHLALARDEAAARRQIVVIDRQGQVAAWTGEQCSAFAGHLSEPDVAVAGNLLAGPEVLSEMLGAYRPALEKSGFAAALLAALDAGAAAGGDSRGLGSAALRVQADQAFPDIDIRVDRSGAPLAALAELLAEASTGPYADFFAEVPRRNR